jgi:outer membrane protein assembly factor BamD
MYREATELFQKEEYKKAAETFADITYKYPYYNGAAQAQLMEMYSYYLTKDYDNLLPTAENFIKTYPASSDIPYVYYLRALTYYNQIEIPQRDQEITRQAKQMFIELLTRFPNSQYTQDAKAKINLIEDHLAAQEMIVGRFYLKGGNVLGAINRFKTVMKDYSTTSHVEEALYRLTEAYMFLGIKSEAIKYAATLGHNYPQSKWYRESYKLINQ